LRRPQRVLGEAPPEIGSEIEAEFGLGSVALENLSDRLLHVTERRVNDFRPNAARERFDAKLREPDVKRGK
jgi:hypothetical protein